MLSLKNREDAVKAEIPKILYMAIVKLQATENLDWEDACMRAAELVDGNSVEFKRAVKLEAQDLYKSRFMRELNVARKTIEDQAFQSGMNRVRVDEDNFHVPCSVCGKPMHISSRDNNWQEEKRVLYEAFRGWRHTTCTP